MQFSRKKARCFLPLLTIFLCLFFLSFLAWKRTDGFRSYAIEFAGLENFKKSNWKSGPEKKAQAEIPVTRKTRQILRQKFYYLGRGRQVFVFVSEDEKYVIKFFNFHHFYYPLGFKKIPFLKDKSQRLFSVCSSYKLAFTKLQKETALVYVHLDRQKLDRGLGKISLFNSIGLPLKVDLDKTYFVLQEKAEPFFPHLSRLAREKKLRPGVNAFLDAVAKRLSCKIVDDDLDIAKNYGFIKDKAVNFDAGRLLQKKHLSRQMQRKEFYKSAKKLVFWIDSNYPEEKAYLISRLELLADQGF